MTFEEISEVFSDDVDDMIESGADIDVLISAVLAVIAQAVIQEKALDGVQLHVQMDAEGEFVVSAKAGADRQPTKH